MQHLKHWIAALSLSVAALPALAQQEPAPFTFNVPVNITNLDPQVAGVRVDCFTYKDQTGSNNMVTSGNTSTRTAEGRVETTITVRSNLLPNGRLSAADANKYLCNLSLTKGNRRCSPSSAADKPVWCRPDANGAFVNIVEGDL